MGTRLTSLKIVSFPTLLFTPIWIVYHTAGSFCTPAWPTYFITLQCDSLAGLIVNPIHPVAHMSPQNPISLWDFIWGLILGVNIIYMLFCFFKLFLIGCIYSRYGVDHENSVNMPILKMLSAGKEKC